MSLFGCVEVVEQGDHGGAVDFESRWTAGRTVTGVHEIARRRRNQPAPPHVIFEALTDLERPGAHPWLALLDDEVRPRVLRASAPATVVWSSIWTQRPDAVIEFDLPPDGHGGTALQWTVQLDAPPAEVALIGHLRQRMNVLVNANLRYSFGQ